MMSEYSKRRTGSEEIRMKKVWIAVICVICVIALVAGAGAAFVYSILHRTYTEDKPVEKPDIVSAVPKEDETLELVDGTPDDIGEDYDVDLNGEDVEQAPIYEVVPIDENVINILFIGQDTGLEWNQSTRSDSCILVSYNREKNSVKMVSIMRDTWTHIDGHGWNRINAAYSFGGAGLLINTLNDMFHLDIQNYVITGFDEFKDCVDMLGGLDMELTEKEAAYIDSSLKAGMTHLTGEMALIHARNRRTGDGDFGRVRRQRDIILAAYNKLRAEGNASTYLNFINFALGNIRTNMDTGEIITLGMEVLQADSLDIAYARIPFDGTWSYATKNGKAVLAIDYDENEEKLKEFLYGE